MSKIKNEYKIVNVSVASIYNKPSFSSELITQALFWEKISILKIKDDWFKVRLKDKYYGWIHSFFVLDENLVKENFQKLKNWYFVKDKFCEISLSNNVKYFLSFGTMLPCQEGKLFKLLLPNGKKVNVDRKKLVVATADPSFDEILKWSKNLLGSPYLWGGKSSFGYDCSGLIQSLLLLKNINFPRDTKDQISSDYLISSKFNIGKRGDLIYFFDNDKPNHVGIFLTSEVFIHSSGFVKMSSVVKGNIFYDEGLSIMKSKIFKFK